MSQANKNTILYHLKGSSLEAAKRLQDEVTQELRNTSVLKKGNFESTQDGWLETFQILLARLEQDAHEILELTGLKSPAIRVYRELQTLPRAYAEYPQIFISPEKDASYFMYVPVDYKGKHFIPKNSVEMDSQQTENIGNLLFAGGWLGNAPIFHMNKYGVETPTDYQSPSDTDLRQAFTYAQNGKICFIAFGRSLEIVSDYKVCTEKWRQHLETAKDVIIAETIKTKVDILCLLPLGEDINITVNYSYFMRGGDQTTLLLSIRREGKNNIFDAGKPLQALTSPAYLLTERGGGEYIVSPRYDTPEGQALAVLIEAIPSTPSLSVYPELSANYKSNINVMSDMLGATDVVPQVVEVGGHTVLVYNCANLTNEDINFCPPDAIPFPVEAYEWLRSDEGDTNLGIPHPPKPKILTDILAKVRAKMDGAVLKNAPSQASPHPSQILAPNINPKLC